MQSSIELKYTLYIFSTIYILFNTSMHRTKMYNFSQKWISMQFLFQLLDWSNFFLINHKRSCFSKITATASLCESSQHLCILFQHTKLEPLYIGVLHQTHWPHSPSLVRLEKRYKGVASWILMLLSHLFFIDDEFLFKLLLLLFIIIIIY